MASMMTANTFKSVVLSLALITLGACSSTFRSDVATFHKLTAPQGERLMIVPMNEERKDSLEFQQYAAILANHLRNEGYKATGEKDPDLIVGFDVQISDGREKVTATPGMHTDFYWRSYWYWGRFWHPVYPIGRDFDDRIVTRTVYTATLWMEIRKPNGDLVFEGRAETETRNRAVPEVVPYLAEALFENFPGPSGVTRHVKLDLSDEE
ncbi:DUF4136 domain-containing protein [Kordiimonas aestuarii]|uniref:DUF4136 domain-containing protein n=1 Tax=Kordiimonas aestuarii TaxID=1005925 RepID=UPI0021D2150C|nr:DUF4136 domain-containing protein [Kordiimonas aestuarii]